MELVKLTKNNLLTPASIPSLNDEDIQSKLSKQKGPKMTWPFWFL